MPESNLQASSVPGGFFCGHVHLLREVHSSVPSVGSISLEKQIGVCLLVGGGCENASSRQRPRARPHSAPRPPFTFCEVVGSLFQWGGHAHSLSDTSEQNAKVMHLEPISSWTPNS